MITAEQFAEWKSHPVTVEIFDSLREVKESIKEQLAAGNTIGPDAEATHGFTNRAIGKLDGIGQLLNIRYDSDGYQEDVGQEGY